MADPISVASGVITFVVFALQASKRLYETVDSFKSHKRNVRDLADELVSLQGALTNLQDHAGGTGADRDLQALELPLDRCGKACEEFEAVIKKVSSHSKTRTSFRDWAKIQYLGNDINGFRGLLAGYKATITIAICDVNMRTTKVTAALLDDYKNMIEDTTSELEEQLRDINDKLQQLTARGTEDPFDSEYSEDEMMTIEEDKKSIEQCIAICVQVSHHIQQVEHPNVKTLPRSSASSKASDDAKTSEKARKITGETLSGCKTELANTTTILQRQLAEVYVRLSSVTGKSLAAETEGAARELESIKQCLAIVSRASEQAKEKGTHVFEDVKMEDDGHQIIVATMGDLLSAKRVTVGSRSVQWLGQMSDESLQRLADKRDPISVRYPFVEHPGTREGQPKFEGRHGMGRVLSQTT